MNVLIQLTIADVDTGPTFNLFSDDNGYSSPFETGVSKTALLTGYTSSLVPVGTTIIRVVSVGVCSNYIDLPLTNTKTTSSTTTNPFAKCLNTNPTFEFNLDGWDIFKSGGILNTWQWSPNYGGSANYIWDDEGGYIRQNILTIGQTYRITFNYYIVDNTNNSFIYVTAGTTNSGVLNNSNGTHNVDITLTCAGNTYFSINATSGTGIIKSTVLFVNNVCIEEIN